MKTMLLGYGIGWHILLPNIETYAHRLKRPLNGKCECNSGSPPSPASCNCKDNVIQELVTAQGTASFECTKCGRPIRVSRCEDEQMRGSDQCTDSRRGEQDYTEDCNAPAIKRTEGNRIIDQDCGFCDFGNMYVYHTGAAVGGSSILLITTKRVPDFIPHIRPFNKCFANETSEANGNKSPLTGGCANMSDCERETQVTVQEATSQGSDSDHSITKIEHTHYEMKTVDLDAGGGIVVSILTNYTGVNFTKDAIKISDLFRQIL